MSSAGPAPIFAEADIVVVGGGIAGASVAYELATDRRVVLLEQELDLGVHSTGRSAAMFLPNYGNDAIRALSAASRPFLASPPGGFCDVNLLRQTGAVTVAGVGQVERLLDEARRLNCAIMDLQGLFRRVPLLRRSAVAAAFEDTAAAAIDVDALFQGFLRGARRRGAMVVAGAAVQEGQYCADRWTLQTTRGPVIAEIVINAAGAWADEVAVRCGVPPLGIAPLRRTAAIVTPPDGIDVHDWPMVMDLGETIYFKPDGGRLAISPADETPALPHDVQADELDVAIAVARFEELVDMSVRRVPYRWAGLRSFSPDRTPVVGPDPSVPAFHWLAGQGGYGIQTSPALARLSAAQVRGRLSSDAEYLPGLRLGNLTPARMRQGLQAVVMEARK